jgi:hypothetical protein
MKRKLLLLSSIVAIFISNNLFAHSIERKYQDGEDVIMHVIRCDNGGAGSVHFYTTGQYAPYYSLHPIKSFTSLNEAVNYECRNKETTYGYFKEETLYCTTRKGIEKAVHSENMWILSEHSAQLGCSSPPCECGMGKKGSKVKILKVIPRVNKDSIDDIVKITDGTGTNFYVRKKSLHYR